MTEIPDLNDVATAALQLISAFEHGHSVAALEAVLAREPGRLHGGMLCLRRTRAGRV